jgi:Xaa-Pro aminopeptidase
MAEKKDGSRTHDAPNADALAQFMKRGWKPTPLIDIKPAASNKFAKLRREKVSENYPRTRLVIPAGGLKVRSADTDFRFRAHSAFSHLTGIGASEVVPDSVLVLEPKAEGGHTALLFVHPRSPRDSDEFYRNAKYGEFWIGRRMTIEETQVRFGIEVRHIETLESFLSDEMKTYAVRGLHSVVDKQVEKRKKKEAELLTFLSELRLIKDEFEIGEIQAAVNATARGFEDMVRKFPQATKIDKGERLIEGTFFTRARVEGNDLGYDSIVASGSHACILHWIKNDGAVKNGDLILIDAGIEMDSLYTADITRTLPVNGKFTEEQRRIYMLVYEAQKASFAAIKPGANFKDLTTAAHEVLAHGLSAIGALPISAEESLQPSVGLHRRWTVHGVSHMLGIDVHDCEHARNENYRDTELKPGMILTVEPGLYIHPDDELFPPQYRGIGVRIEDDVLITETGYRNLSQNLPSHPDEIEVWISNLIR